MLEASVLVVLLAGVYLIGLLFWQIARVTHIVAGGTRRVRAQLSSEIAGLTSEQIRERLLESPYFTHDLRRQRPIEDFLTRIARRDEVALRREFSRRRLYSMLSKSEKAVGRRGRPEASDYIEEWYAFLDELARRAAAGNSPDPQKAQ